MDQNISLRVVEKISSVFPEARQVRELGLENSSDQHIWQFAKKNDFTIVSFDADFYDLASLKGHPPKIIWLRTGNTRSQDIAQLLLNKVESIKAGFTQEEVPRSSIAVSPLRVDIKEQIRRHTRHGPQLFTAKNLGRFIGAVKLNGVKISRIVPYSNIRTMARSSFSRKAIPTRSGLISQNSSFRSTKGVFSVALPDITI